MRFALYMLLVSVCCNGATGPEKLRFLVMSDPHFGSSDYTNPQEPVTNLQFAATLNPAFALFIGDITSFADSNGFRAFSNAITTNWSFPSYYTSGNHDKNEQDNTANPDWKWWDLMLANGQNNPQGTNRNWSFNSGPIKFILFESYAKTNVPDNGMGVVTTNTSQWVAEQLRLSIAEEKTPIICTHYQIVKTWPWGDKWYVTWQPPSDRYDLTNAVAAYNCKYSFSGHAHSTNNYASLWAGHTNISTPSVRSLDIGGTDATHYHTNGAFNLVRVFTNAFIVDMYWCDPPQHNLGYSEEFPLDTDWSNKVRMRAASANVGKLD